MISWQKKRLRDVVTQWYKGSTPNRSHEEYYSKEEGIPWVRVSDLQGGMIERTEESLSQEGAAKIPGWVPKGAVLLSVSGTIGKTAIAGREVKLNQAVQGLVFDETQVLPEYAYFYFQFFRPWLEETANMVTIPNLPKSRLENLAIFFPCLAEQEYIVLLLKKAEKALEKQKDLLGEIEEMLFASISCKLGDYAEGSCRISLGELLSGHPRAGAAVKREETSSLRCIENLEGEVWTRENSGDCPRVTLLEKENGTYDLKKGDLLVSRSRGGNSILLLKDLEETVWGRGLLRLRVKEDVVLPEFLLLWLRYSSRYLRQEPAGSAVLDLTSLEKLSVPLVSRQGQEKFAAILRKAARVQREALEVREGMAEFYRTMLVWAFTGKLSRDYRRQYNLEDPDPSFFAGDYYFKLDPSPERSLREQAHEAWEDVFLGGRKEILGCLSPFQREVLHVFVICEKPLPIHTMLKTLRQINGRLYQRFSIQDAIRAVKVLEGLGFLERSVPEKILLGEDEITDFAGRPIVIQKYEAVTERLEAEG